MFSVMGRVVARAECGGWEFPPRAVRARPLNPRTPARPDLKSGAVVLAWLPPRAAHRTLDITAFWLCDRPDRRDVLSFVTAVLAAKRGAESGSPGDPPATL